MLATPKNICGWWVREHDPDGYVQMPGMRIISGAADGKRWYDVNQASAATPNGLRPGTNHSRQLDNGCEQRACEALKIAKDVVAG
jgi:hypothetical protein